LKVVFEILLMVQRGLADIDPHNFRTGVPVCENRRLVGSAIRDENVQIALLFLIGPKNPMEMRRVEPMPDAWAQCPQVLDRLRMPPALVLAGDNIGERIVAQSRTILVIGAPLPSTSTGGL
jgi:hypothetical protein